MSTACTARENASRECVAIAYRCAAAVLSRKIAGAIPATVNTADSMLSIEQSGSVMPLSFVRSRPHSRLTRGKIPCCMHVTAAVDVASLQEGRTNPRTLCASATKASLDGSNVGEGELMAVCQRKVVVRRGRANDVEFQLGVAGEHLKH